ncbi:MAG: ABC transporter permease [Clostridia bacterium]|nr:ABC transporter permease [Clostridia bacterium]
MVEEHKSVSYWKDAWRRFRANRVSMVSLFVFILLLLFAFVGPSFIAYSYEEQYREAAKLFPFEKTEAQEAAEALLAEGADGVLVTNLLPGSQTYLKKGNYYITARNGKTIAFNLPKSKEKIILVLESEKTPALWYVDQKAYLSGTYEKTEIETTDAPAENAAELKLTTSFFPHIFGTDSAGRDLLARCMYGTRVSLIIGIVAALIVLVIGSIYGAISGLAGGAVDFVMMRIVELIYSVPDVLIVLLLQVVLKEPLQKWFDASQGGIVKAMSDLGVGVVSIFITFALLYWVGMARIVRGQVLMLKKQEYVTAARALGVPGGRIVKRHLIPNCVGQLVITTCLQIPSAIFLESFLSFLGMGVSAPMASLGSLCSDALDVLQNYPYRMLCPAIILTILVLSLNLVGDGIRDALDPRLKK